MKRRAALAVAIAAALAAWTAAGYHIGLTKGLGWRHAVIRDGCHLYCPAPVRPPSPAPSRGV